MLFILQVSRYLLLIPYLCLIPDAFGLDSVTLQLKWTHQFQFAGYYAAIDQGYYREAGLDVHLEEARPEINPIDKVLGGEAQYGIGTSSLLQARGEGKPVVVLAVIFQHSPYAIYTAKNRNIQSLRDLVDKPIMLEPQSEELLAYLRKEGVPLNRLNKARHSFNPQDLIDGKVEAISGYTSHEPYIFKLAHFDYQAYSPQEKGFDFYGDNLFTSEQEIRDHPERVKAFRDASLRGWRYAKNHRDEVIDLILKKYSKKQTREFLLFESDAMIPLLQPDLIDVGYSNPERWKHIANIYTALGLLPYQFSLKGFLFEEHMKDNRWLSLILGLALPAIGLVSLIAVSFYRMNRKLKLAIREKERLANQDLARKQALELLTKGAPLKEIMDVLVSCVENQNNGKLCSILLVDDNGRHLKTIAAPSLPDFYNAAIDDTPITPNAGSGCAAAFSGKRVIIENIQAHANSLPFREIGGKAGLESCWSEPILSSKGKVLGIFIIYHRKVHRPSDDDISLIEQLANLTSIVIEKTHDAQELQYSHDLLTKISAEAPGLIFQYRLYPDGRSCFPFMSETSRKLYGMTPEDLREDATALLQLLHPEDADRFVASIRESARNLSHWTEEYRINLPVLGTRWRLGNARPEKLEDGSVLWHGFITDITDRKIVEEQIRHMAQYDTLTDLPNRALLTDRVQQSLAQAKRDKTRLAILFLDLDTFKPINDSLGHAIGDMLLKKAATVIQGSVRESDTVARVGGDEFIVLLPVVETDQDASSVAEKIRVALDRSFEIEGYVLKISSSIGIAIYPEHGEDAFELTKHADLAMYYAKRNGKNRVMLYHSNMKISVQ